MSKITVIPAKYEAQISAYLAQLRLDDPEEDKQYEVPNTDEKKVDSGLFEEEDSKLYEVSKVLDYDCDNAGGSWRFLVRFKGYRTPEWVLDDDCNCEGLISQFLADVGIPTVYCVCRVSTRNQAQEEKHVSLAAQQAQLRQTFREMPEFAEMRANQDENLIRFKAVKIVGSAYKGIPKELARIGAAAKKGDVIMIYRVDRLSRNLALYFNFLQELNERGVRIYAHDEKLWYGADNLVFFQGILDANKEAQLLGKRVRESLKFRRERGDHIGPAKYGYKTERMENGMIVLKEHEAEQEVIQEILETQHASPARHRLASSLNARGLLKRGKQWTRQMIQQVQRRG